ncbi:MAG: hypothetical protein QXX12_01250 [Nanopusillaceae archaeon]
MKKKAVEIALGTLAILIIILIVLISIIVYYFVVYSSGTRTTRDIVITIENQTSNTTQLIRNMTRI